MIRQFVLSSIIVLAIIILFSVLKMFINEMKKLFFCKSLDEIKNYFSLRFGLPFILLVPMPLLVMVLVNTPGHTTTDNDWIGFFGSYFGAVLGGIITLFVLVMTLKNNESNLELTLQEERKQHEENKALAIRPYLTASKEDTLISDSGNILNDVTFSYGFISTEKDMHHEYISLKNIGLGTAVNIKVHSISVFGKEVIPDSQGCRNTWQNNLEVSDIVTIALRLGLDWTKYLLGNKYMQSVICEYRPKLEQKDLYGKNLSLKLVNNNRLTIECVTAPRVKD